MTLLKRNLLPHVSNLTPVTTSQSLAHDNFQSFNGKVRSLKATLRQIGRSSTVAWGVALVSILAAILFAVLAWHFHKATLDEVLTQVQSLDRDAWRKICAHRANNIPTYRQALGHFNCIEIDVHIEPTAGGSAAVYHPPESNNHGLTLDFLLTNELLPPGKLWLDTKDLSKSNWSAYLAQLKRLIPASRRSDVVVETVWSDADVQEASSAFRLSGFAFSYYLPTDEARACGSSHTADCNSLRRQVVATVARGFSHVSFDYRAYQFAKSIRGDLPAEVKFLTWDLSKSWPKPKLLEDVEIYIINLPTAYLN